MSETIDRRFGWLVEVTGKTRPDLISPKIIDDLDEEDINKPVREKNEKEIGVEKTVRGFLENFNQQIGENSTLYMP